MPTPSCKTCGKPGFKDATGVMQHEQRANPADSGGRRAAPTLPASSDPPADEKPPKREHLLHRKIL